MTPIVLPAVARPRVSVLMVTFGGWEWVQRALRALVESTEPAYELILVDNASPDGLAAALRENVRNATLVANDVNRGFGPGSNQAASLARGRHLVFLNSDAYVHAGWLEPLAEAVSSPGVAAASPRVLNDDGSLQEAGCLVYSGGETEFYGFREDPAAEPYASPRDVDYASAACLLVRRSVFERMGGFDPVFAPAYYEDVDLCLRLRRDGWRCLYEPRSVVTHSRGLSTSGDTSRASAQRNLETFRSRWKGLLETRPLFRPPHVAGAARRRVAARDALFPTRVLVVEPAAREGRVDPLLDALAGRRAACATTLLSPGPVEATRAARLARSGIEVVPAGDSAEEWLLARRLHYDVVFGGESLAPALEETQPQARRLAIPESGIDEALADSGIGPTD